MRERFNSRSAGPVPHAKTRAPVLVRQGWTSGWIEGGAGLASLDGESRETRRKRPTVMTGWRPYGAAEVLVYLLQKRNENPLRRGLGCGYWAFSFSTASSFHASCLTPARQRSDELPQEIADDVRSVWTWPGRQTLHPLRRTRHLFCPPPQ